MPKPEDDHAYLGKGHLFFLLGRFRKAAEDFESATRINSQNPFGILSLYLATERKGGDGKAVLKLQSSDIDLNEWPGPLVLLYLGHVSFKQELEQWEVPDSLKENN